MGTIRFEIVHIDGQAMFGAPIDHHYIIDLTNREEYFYVEFDDPLAVIPGDTYHFYLQLASVDQAHWPYTSNTGCYSKEAGYLFGWEVVGDFDFATYGYSSTAGQTQVPPSNSDPDQQSAPEAAGSTTSLPSSAPPMTTSTDKKSLKSTPAQSSSVAVTEEVKPTETVSTTAETLAGVEDSTVIGPEDKSLKGRVIRMVKGGWNVIKNNWRTILEVLGVLIIVALAVYSYKLFKKQARSKTNTSNP